MLPDEQHGVEHGLEQVHQGCEVIHGVHLLKVLAQRLQKSYCVIGLQAGCVDILQQPVGACLLSEVRSSSEMLVRFACHGCL